MHIAIIGAGLIGAAAARHLAAAGHRVTLIGPHEPADHQTHRGVYASHYDEGRITRSLDPDPFWSRAGAESIARYDQIARAGRIAFYTPSGCALAAPAGSATMAALRKTANGQGVACDHLTGAALAQRFPVFDFPQGAELLFECHGAGHISPRKLVAAQINAATGLGALHVPAIADGLTEDSHGVTIRHGTDSTRADRVLVAAGGYTNSVLPVGLHMQVRARTVVLMALDAAEAQRLRHLPSLIWLGADGHRPYLLPPIRYPDGVTYLKMGGDPRENPLPQTRQALGDWFRSGGDSEVGAMLLDLTQQRIPGLKVARHRTMACITSFSPSGYPMIGMVSDRIGVATAGCGKAAKSSDELGRLATLALTDQALPDWAHVAAL